MIEEPVINSLLDQCYMVYMWMVEQGFVMSCREKLSFNVPEMSTIKEMSLAKK